jgi:hypothetical protein
VYKKNEVEKKIEWWGSIRLPAIIQGSTVYRPAEVEYIISRGRKNDVS